MHDFAHRQAEQHRGADLADTRVTKQIEHQRFTDFPLEIVLSFA
jgi:hypothetical protein